MTDHQLDDRIRTAYPTPPPSAVDEQTWQQIVSSLRAAPEAATPARRRRRPARVALIAAALLVIISGVAIAAEPALLKRIFPQGSAADQIDALKAPRTDANRVDLRELEEIRGILGHHAFQKESEFQIEDARVLLRHEEGPVRVLLYAIPDSEGRVCNFWASSINGGGLCTGATFAPDKEVVFSSGVFGWTDGWETVTSIQGISTDRVARVRVRMDDGTTQDAIMGENSFLWYPRPYVDLEPYIGDKTRPAPRDTEPAKLLIELTDGSTVQEPVR